MDLYAGLAVMKEQKDFGIKAKTKIQEFEDFFSCTVHLGISRNRRNPYPFRKP